MSAYPLLSRFCQTLTSGDNYLALPTGTPGVSEATDDRTWPCAFCINTHIMILTLTVGKVISIILGHAFSALYFAHRAFH